MCLQLLPRLVALGGPRLHVPSRLIPLRGEYSGLLARLITRPLHQLARAARKLEVGEPGPVRAVGSYREVQTLAHALNSLVHKLRERAEELRDANAGLEHRVQARTAELAEAFERVRLNGQPRPVTRLDRLGAIVIGKRDWTSEGNNVCAA